MNRRYQLNKVDLTYSKELCDVLVKYSSKNLTLLCVGNLFPDESFEKYMINKELSFNIPTSGFGRTYN